MSSPIQWIRPEQGFAQAQLAVTTAVGSWPGATQHSEAFNLGLNVNDQAERVWERRKWIQHQLGRPVVWLSQVHGNQVFDADQLNPEQLNMNLLQPGFDASVTSQVDVALAVLTADCLPVLFFARSKTGQSAVGAAHAGWRGLAAGVLERTAQAVANKAQVTTDQVQAWMGPAIGPTSFEVGHDVFDTFVNQSDLVRKAFESQPNGRFLASLYELACQRLIVLGICTQGGGADTLADPKWFSHRACLKAMRRPSGRFASLIQLI